MRHIKEYSIFESLKDDYQQTIDDIERYQIDSLSKIKLKVDEFMYYILDEYQIDSSSDTIDPKSFKIKYHQIECKFSDINKFINLFETVVNNIKSEFDIEYGLTSWIKISDTNHRYHEINYGHISNINEIKKWLDNYNNTQPNRRVNYDLFHFSILFY